MPRIPAYEDIGTQATTVEPERYFSVISEGIVEQYAGVEIWTESMPEDRSTVLGPNPYDVLEEAQDRAVDSAIASMQYPVHVALHNLWSASFGDPEGSTIRDLLNKMYLQLLKRKQQDHSRESLGSN